MILPSGAVSLCPFEALTRAMSGTILSVRQHLLPLPDRVAQQLVGESANTIRERLRVEVHTLLIQLTIPAAYREPGACDVCGGPKPMLGIDPILRVPYAKTATNPLGTRHAPGTNGHGSNGTGR